MRLHAFRTDTSMALAVALLAFETGCANEPYSPRDCAVTGPDTLVSLSFDQREVTVAVGRTASLLAWARGPGGSFIECPPTYSFWTGDPAIARLEGEIVVRGVSPGTTYLMGRGGGRSDSIPVFVTAAAASVE
jgi:hypothetical protein